jgi:hypothetical protein
MRSLEEQSHFLSDDDSASGSGKIYSLCEMLMEDLNNYCECMIPIDDINTLNIKLFPTLPNPAPVKAWHVPLFAVRIETMMDENWDLTMQRVIPYINGVNSVKRIAGLADADIKLTKQCIKHLLYYGCLLLLDIFHFGAIYAPTAEFTSMIASDLDMQAECARYVNIAFEPGRQEVAVSTIEASNSMRSSHMTHAAQLIDDDFWPLTGKGEIVDGVGIVQLYANLRQGLTVREWCKQNSNMLANIDVRRFLTFGIIKGFLYRVHRYAMRTFEKPHGQKRTNGGSAKKQVSKDDSDDDDDDGEEELRARLLKFLDGTHCFDEICTELCISEDDLMKRLAKPEMGEVVVICK